MGGRQLGAASCCRPRRGSQGSLLCVPQPGRAAGRRALRCCSGMSGALPPHHDPEQVVEEPGLKGPQPLFWTDSACAGYLKANFRQRFDALRISQDYPACRKALSELLNAFRTLREKGCTVGARSYTTVIFLVARFKCSRIAGDLLREALATGLPDESLFFATLTAHARAGDVGRCEKLIGHMRRRGIPLSTDGWNTYLFCISRKCGEHMTRAVFTQAVREGELRPDAVTYNTLLSACTSYQRARDVLAEMRGEGWPPDYPTWAYVLRACVPNGEAREALQCLQEIKASCIEPTVVLYTTVMSACSKAGDFELLYDTYESMLEEGIRPTSTAYAVVASACVQRAERKGDRYELLAGTVFRQALRTGQARSIHLCTRMMQLYAKTAQAVKAKELLAFMRAEGVKQMNPVGEAFQLALAADPQRKPIAAPQRPHAASGGGTAQRIDIAAQVAAAAMAEQWGHVRNLLERAANISGQAAVSAAALLADTALAGCDRILRGSGGAPANADTPHTSAEGAGGVAALRPGGLCLLVAAFAVIASDARGCAALRPAAFAALIPADSREANEAALAKDILQIAGLAADSTREARKAARSRQGGAAAALRPLPGAPREVIEPVRRTEWQRTRREPPPPLPGTPPGVPAGSPPPGQPRKPSDLWLEA
eukprot:TRINITY_DN38772_c0_g1_i1.p2 TRINITY_DN38772_c0_g1~~TRINITY_DN38772_c0_g1_i1.p2  ORF type:complete len:657 (+),score=100.58 TRINITY_DN38772_c0_g1_i1:127-2097(+)